MKVIDLLNNSDGRLISVELVPPELINGGGDGKRLDQGKRDFEDLAELFVEEGVRYIDITYHAENIHAYRTMNGAILPVRLKLRAGTESFAAKLKERYRERGVEIVPHAICTGFTREETQTFLMNLWAGDIENVLAIKGDDPKGPDGKKVAYPTSVDGNNHANELIRQITDLREGRFLYDQTNGPIDFCIGAACYPEMHPDSRTLEDDLHWTLEKQREGANYLVTQMFFDNEAYERFVERARDYGITIPIVPGLKPISSYGQTSVLPQLFGCNMPDDLRAEIERYKPRDKHDEQNKEAIKRVGIEWCTEQAQGLRRYGAPSVHLYAIRETPQSSSVLQVIRNLNQSTASRVYTAA